MSKHTPGPWASEGFEQVAGNGVFYGGLIVGDNGETVVAQCVMPCNASVIAAAPELLEALKMGYADTMDYIQRNHLSGAENNRWLVLARAAIAKAEGGQT